MNLWIRHWMLRGLVLLIGGTTMSALSAAAEDGASPPLDKRLLKDLDDDLLQGLPAAAPGKAAKNDLDAKLKEDLEGSDIGAAPVEDPLQQISQRMRAAQQRIGQQDLSLETRELQREIVADLAKLIEQARQQRPGSGKKAEGQGRGAAQGGEEGGNPTPGSVTDSTNRVEKGAASPAEKAEMRDVLRRHWGHLPEKLREELQNSLSEQFLPKYEKLIEAYYKRLAEERRGSP